MPRLGSLPHGVRDGERTRLCADLPGSGSRRAARSRSQAELPAGSRRAGFASLPLAEAHPPDVVLDEGSGQIEAAVVPADRDVPADALVGGRRDREAPLPRPPVENPHLTAVDEQQPAAVAEPPRLDRTSLSRLIRRDWRCTTIYRTDSNPGGRCRAGGRISSRRPVSGLLHRISRPRARSVGLPTSMRRRSCRR